MRRQKVTIAAKSATTTTTQWNTIGHNNNNNNDNGGRLNVIDTQMPEARHAGAVEQISIFS